MNATTKTEAFLLPDGYDPQSDKGLTVVEHFLDYDLPPTSIHLEWISETQQAAVATWET